MARSKSAAGEPDKDQASASTPFPSPTAARWAKITWDDLDRWAGSATVARGQQYQSEGRVKDLAFTEEEDLLATVEGSQRYATTVALGFGTNPTLESTCTCFVGFRCKHAVAVVAAFIHATGTDRLVPLADSDDPRWLRLQDAADGELAGDSAPHPAIRPDHWDAQIMQYLQARSQPELVDLVWSLLHRYPIAYQELRKQLRLADRGGVD